MSLFTTATRNITAEEFDALLSHSEGHELPDPTLGERLQHGLGYRTFTITDGDRTLDVCLQPADNTVTCDYSNPKRVPAYAILSRSDAAWYLSPDVVDSCDVLPALRQAFHEGESVHDREATYRYHFSDGETILAVSESDPVQRLDNPVTITAVEFLGGLFPQEWFLETADGEFWYLRERSGSIKLYDAISHNFRENLVFKAFIGNDHPGTQLKPEEVINIIDAVDYINIVDDPDDEVPQAAHDEYWEGHEDIEMLDDDILLGPSDADDESDAGLE